ncbi:UNVERIFIED_CONTAM: hypothetical protein PYX00_001042 [Menopon gallinae]|uniref:RING-type domain-containing protein n=1 Tax=Menopon gallinae TaxID=328185 RepID=A0AAW2IB01_9NEOP
MRAGKRLNIASLNAHLICVICSGYYVEATTIVECLHTFCRSCIINYLKSSKFCPICDVQIHHSKPWSSLRPDKTMQDLVYKLVPGLYQDEMRRRRQFYSGLAEDSAGAGEGEEKGLLPHGARFFAQDDSISLSLEYYTGQSDSENDEKGSPANGKPKRYLQCPAAVTVRHLKKFLQMKYGIGVDSWVDIIYNDECLPDYFSLIDVAYTFTWRRTSPMRLSYRIFTKKPVKSVKAGNKYQTVSAVEDERNCAGKHTSSLEQQRQSEYLGNFNLNPTKSGFCKSSNANVMNNNNNVYSEIKSKTFKDELNIDDGSGDKLFPSSEDSNASGLRIMSEKENSEESQESIAIQKPKDCDLQSFDEAAEDGFSAKKLLKSKHKEVKKERKKHEAAEKRRKSAGHAEEEKKFADGRKRRRSMLEGPNDDERLSRFEIRDRTEEEELEPLANLKNEALRKVFVLKDKPEPVKEEEVRRKKRKKSKHHEGEAKKRKTDLIPTSPSILSFAKDPLKLKVKLTPIIKPSEEEPAEKPAEKEIEEWECEKDSKAETEKDDSGKKSVSDKERLLHLRAVRHKNIIKTNPQSYINAPRSLTISKVDASDQQVAKPRILESRPSLEIMLVPPSDAKPKPAEPEKKPEPSSKEVMDTFGVLDLSEKSTRTKESSLSPQKEETVERTKKAAQQSIMQIAQNLVNRKLSPILPDKRFDSDPTTAAAAMRNLKTLSDTAVNILMAAQSKGFPASPESPKRYPTLTASPPQKPKDCENGTGLKIPMFPAARERNNPIPPVPNLHEIYPKGRGRPPLARPTPPVIKPGQNQTVRQIPNPSALLNRQNNQPLLNRLAATHKFPENGDAAPKTSKLGSIPPLQSIKSKLIISDELSPLPKLPNSNAKPVQNGSDGGPISAAVKNGDDQKKAVVAKVTNGANTLRRIESMARNIESVAAGLTARAVSNAMVDAK